MPENCANDHFRELRERITIEADPALGRGRARLRFFPMGGPDSEALVFEAGADRQKKDTDLQQKQVLEKSSSLLTPFLKKPDVERLQELALSVGEAADIADLCAALGTIARRGRIPEHG